MPDPTIQTLISNSEAETAAIAHLFAQALNGGEYVSLEGELGAGKTFFSRQLAEALGIGEAVTSPTFAIQKLYPYIDKAGTPKELAHYDLYRIQAYNELVDLGFEDHDASTIVLAEWGNLFLNEFPVVPVRVKLEIQPDDVRVISIIGLSLQLQYRNG